MDLSMEKEILYVPNNKSVFLIEEISKRNDYELIGKKGEFYFHWVTVNN
jgi:hypothetical protein